MSAIHDRKNQHGSDSMLIFSACSGRKSRCLFTLLSLSIVWLSVILAPWLQKGK